MTREEFTEKAIQICNSAGLKFYAPTTDEMKLIDYVYMYYPSISNVGGKEQIAYLYVRFGMRLIRDMRNTAHVMEDYEIKERKLLAELSRLKENRKAFLSGFEMCANGGDDINA